MKDFVKIFARMKPIAVKIKEPITKPEIEEFAVDFWRSVWIACCLEV